MIINKEDLWGCQIGYEQETESICMNCLADKELEGARLESFFFKGSPQFDGTLTPALMFCDRCHRQIKCPWATIDRESAMAERNSEQKIREEKVKAMVDALVKSGYGINEIQEVMSKPYSLEFKDGHIEIREEGDIPF